MNYCYGKGVQKCVLCWEAVPFSEGPLSSVPLLWYSDKELTFDLDMTSNQISTLFCLVTHDTAMFHVNFDLPLRLLLS